MDNIGVVKIRVTPTIYEFDCDRCGLINEIDNHKHDLEDFWPSNDDNTESGAIVQCEDCGTRYYGIVEGE